VTRDKEQEDRIQKTVDRRRKKQQALSGQQRTTDHGERRTLNGEHRMESKVVAFNLKA
jgi:hypothetical protein